MSSRLESCFRRGPVHVWQYFSISRELHDNEIGDQQEIQILSRIDLDFCEKLVALIMVYGWLV